MIIAKKNLFHILYFSVVEGRFIGLFYLKENHNLAKLFAIASSLKLSKLSHKIFRPCEGSIFSGIDPPKHIFSFYTPT